MSYEHPQPARQDLHRKTLVVEISVPVDYEIGEYPAMVAKELLYDDHDMPKRRADGRYIRINSARWSEL